MEGSWLSPNTFPIHVMSVHGRQCMSDQHAVVVHCCPCHHHRGPPDRSCCPPRHHRCRLLDHGVTVVAACRATVPPPPLVALLSAAAATIIRRRQQPPPPSSMPPSKIERGVGLTSGLRMSCWLLGVGLLGDLQKHLTPITGKVLLWSLSKWLLVEFY